MAAKARREARFRLHEILEEAGVSQNELKRRTGISFTTINRIANNLAGQVSLRTLARLADALGVDPGDLIAWEGEPKRGRSR